MRICVTGGRNYTDRATLFVALDRIHGETPITLLAHGDCRDRNDNPCGADALSGEWAAERGVICQPFRVYRAVDGPWPGAGPRRNGRMLWAVRPDRVVAFCGGRGTADCVRQAEGMGVPVQRVGW